MESIANLYDCTIECNGECASSDCTLDCNEEYQSPLWLCLGLQWTVCIIFMTVSKIVMASITHLYHCILDYNGEYRSPF